MAFIKKIQLPNGEIYDIQDEDAARQIDIDTAIEQHDTSTEAHQDIRETIDNIQSDIKSQSIYEKDVLESDWILNEETQRYDLTIAQSEHNCGLDAYVVEVASITDTTRESIIFNSNVAIQTGEITVSVSTPSACRIVIMGNIQILTTGKANMYLKEVDESDWTYDEVNDIYTCFIGLEEHSCGIYGFVLDAAKLVDGNYTSVMKDSDIDGQGNITVKLTEPMIGRILIAGTLIDFIPSTANSGGGSIEQVQADWAQNDNTAVDYIKNKPFYEDGETVVQLDDKFISDNIARKNSLDETNDRLNLVEEQIENIKSEASISSYNVTLVVDDWVESDGKYTQAIEIATAKESDTNILLNNPVTDQDNDLAWKHNVVVSEKITGGITYSASTLPTSEINFKVVIIDALTISVDTVNSAIAAHNTDAAAHSNIELEVE